MACESVRRVGTHTLNKIIVAWDITWRDNSTDPNIASIVPIAKSTLEIYTRTNTTRLLTLCKRSVSRVSAVKSPSSFIEFFAVIRTWMVNGGNAGDKTTRSISSSQIWWLNQKYRNQYDVRYKIVYLAEFAGSNRVKVLRLCTHS